jgi:hypothetical protein
MKTIYNMLAAILLLFAGLQTSAQTDAATTKRIIEDKNFVFQATSAMPMANADVTKVMGRMNGGIAAGGSINLSGSRYDLKVTKDSVEAYLPYYGRAYTAQMNPDEAGIKFKSKDFSYTMSERKKGGWTINIKPKDSRDTQDMNLSVSKDGYATLSVNSNNKQPITFNGVLAEPKKDKK